MSNQPTKLVSRNIGLMLSGLIDSHVHPVIGDYTPRQQQLHWIDSTLHGGVTTLISAGEVHMPGRPRDIIGIKAMAIAAQRWYENFRPSGVKVMAGAPMIEHGMVEQDFKDLADAGVKLLGEVGRGTVKDGKTAKQMVDCARKYGIQSTIHTGGPSIPGSGPIDADMVLETGTDVIGHINGGHSALPDDQIICICESCPKRLEIVHNGNERATLLTLNTARELKYRPHHPWHRCARRLWRATLGHPADDRHARQPRQHARRTGVLLWHRPHHPSAQLGHRHD